MLSKEMLDPQVVDQLQRYGHKEEDYAVVCLDLYVDEMNDGEYRHQGKQEWAIPRVYAKDVQFVSINFTMTNIQFWKNDQESLFSTVGTGYDDLTSPLAFETGDYPPVEHVHK